ncbi:MAG: ATP-binding protein [Thermoplasmata archaeon]|nr:ATP-binding protein [Thermoplasmata archaeon]
MMEIAVLSGKGGTGKTTIVSSYAHLVEKAVLVDCDVDAPNLDLILHSRLIKTGAFMSGKKARVIGSKCKDCESCIRLCRFGAIRKISTASGGRTIEISEDKCEGCGICMRVCPARAIGLVKNKSGDWYLSEINHGMMVHALLKPGEGNSGKLVSFIREKAREIAAKEGYEMIIVDGPPGIGCPVIASLAGADAAVLVAEPTLSGLSDLRRMTELVSRFRIRCLITINRHDINPAISQRIESEAEKIGIRSIGNVPYDEQIVRRIASGENVLTGPDSAGARAIGFTWSNLMRFLGQCGGSDEAE